MLSHIGMRLPLEIHFEILSYFGPPPIYKLATRDLDSDAAGNCERYRATRSMAAVCRGFRYCLVPLVFETVYVLNDHHSPPSHFEKFCKSISEGDVHALTLAKYVKRFVIENFFIFMDYEGPLNDPPFFLEENRRVSICFNALQHMVKLKEFYLNRSSITNDLVRSLGSLSHLDILQIEAGCSIPCPLEVDLLVQFAGLKVSNLYFSDMFLNTAVDLSNHHRHYYSPQREQFYRHICWTHVQAFISQDAAHCHLLKELGLTPPMVYLEELEFHHISISAHEDALLRALSNMPALKSLHIHEVHHPEGTQPYDFEPNFIATKIPHLEHIHAPLPMLKALVPGSSVTSIGIARERLDHSQPFPSGMELWREYVDIFKQSRRRITQLDVPMDFITSVPCVSHFPCLTTLTIRPMHYNWHDNSVDRDLASDPQIIVPIFLRSWTRYSKLRELEFVYDYYSRARGYASQEHYELDEDTYDLLKSNVPTLQWVIFADTDARAQLVDVDEYFMGEEEIEAKEGYNSSD